ncbi:MAG TPA: hypothetical protein VFW85_06020 [Gaiellaceae bacterium]|nr:hypothetical protein [Gaiellaceae bacterium]
MRWLARIAIGVVAVAFASSCGSSPTAQRTTEVAKPPPKPRTDPAWIALRLPKVPHGPVPGYVLIADRNNNRLLLVSPQKKIVWHFDALRGPDDAFFTPGWRSVITNEEFNDTLRQVSLRPQRIVWSYGHAGVAGASPGYLNTPDDAYRLRYGETTVADIRNCRIVTLTPHGKVARVLGGSCVHDPPNGFASPNGDTPLPDGGLLVTEIGGWIDRLSASGRLLWSVRSPVSYPSDAQLLPNGEILVASFESPGKIVELTRFGRVTWSFGALSGPDMLNKPSLAVRWPNGMIAANDDYNHRVIVIDPKTKRIVWQYGHSGVPSAAIGYLDKPDGIDLLPAATLAHGALPAKKAAESALQITRVGTLPQATSRIAAVVVGNRIMALGGLVGGSSSTQILAGPPSHLVSVSSLPIATHDDAAVALGTSIYLLGGGQATSSDAVVRISAAGRARRVGSLGEPLSDLGAATIGNTAYIAGGYTGAKYATGILAFRGSTPKLVARLPVGLRYAGVAALNGKLYIAGGVTTTGDSNAVYSFDPRTRHVRRVATLPSPVAHEPLAALNGSLYLIGSSILRISPRGGVRVAGHLASSVQNAAAVTIGHAIYVLGGDGTNAVLRILAR